METRAWWVGLGCAACGRGWAVGVGLRQWVWLRCWWDAGMAHSGCGWGMHVCMLLTPALQDDRGAAVCSGSA